MAERNNFSDRSFGRAVELLRQSVGYQANFVVGLLVLSIEKPAGDHNQIADITIFRVYTQNLEIAFFAAADRNALIQIKHRGGARNTRHACLSSLHVLDS